MFPLLKIISTLPNDTLLNNSKYVLEVNYYPKTGFVKIGADEKNVNGSNLKGLRQGGEARINPTSRPDLSKTTTCFGTMGMAGAMYQALGCAALFLHGNL